MFQLLRIRLVNFCLFLGRHELEIPPGLTFIVAKNLDEGHHDSNAGGKTTVLNAICWTLFGKKASGSANARVIHDNAKECEVELVFDSFRVIRRAGKKSSLEVRHLDGRSWIGDTEEVQRRLNKHIGLNFNLFKSAIYLEESSHSVQFVKAPAGDRAKILAEMIDDGVFQQAGLLVKKKIRSLEEQLESAQHSVVHINRRHAELKEELVHLRGSLKNQKAAWEREKEDLVRVMSAHKQKVLDAQLVLLKKPPRSLQEVEQDRSSATVTYRALEEELRDLGPLRMPSVRAGEACPTCFRNMTSKDLDSCSQTLHKSKARAATIKRDMDLILRTIEKFTREIEDIRELAKDQARAKKDFEYYRIEADRVLEKLENPPMGTQDTINAIERNRNKLKGVEEEHIRTEKEIATRMVQIDRLKPIQQAFLHEIRNFMFDKLRTHLEQYTEVYLHEIHGGALEVEYPTQSRTAREKFEIDIISNGKKRPLADCSKGEGLRAALAVLLALRATMFATLPIKLNLLLVDDPFGSLDDTGVAHFFEYLGRLAAQQDGGIDALLVTIPRKPESLPVIQVERKYGKSRFLTEERSRKLKR